MMQDDPQSPATQSQADDECCCGGGMAGRGMHRQRAKIEGGKATTTHSGESEEPQSPSKEGEGLHASGVEDAAASRAKNRSQTSKSARYSERASRSWRDRHS